MKNPLRLNQFIFLLLLVSPILIPLTCLDHFAWIGAQEWQPVLLFTLIQALFSAAAAVIFGLMGALGLASGQNRRWRRALEILFLLPNLVPTLVVILAALNFFKAFPYGLSGIILVHLILNVGLVSVAIVHLLEEKAGRMAELAWVEGASRWQFVPVVIRYLASDLGLIFLFVFAICFSSFAVPLLVGGFHGITLEVLIYRKIQASGEWSQALTLTVLQTAILTTLTLFLYRTPTPIRSQHAHLGILQWSGGLVFPLLACGIVIFGLFDGLQLGWQQLQTLTALRHQLWTVLLGTWVVSLGVGAFSVALLFWIAYCWPAPGIAKFLLGYISPSSVITGFALLLIPDLNGDWIFQKLICGIGLISFPAIYRFGWHGRLEGLNSQLQIARTLGANHWMSFSKVVWPQLRRQAYWLAGIAAFWAAGDFALSGIVAGRELTLALVIENVMQSYRLELAVLLVWLLLGAALLSFLFFWSWGYVTSRKSYS